MQSYIPCVRSKTSGEPLVSERLHLKRFSRRSIPSSPVRVERSRPLALRISHPFCPILAEGGLWAFVLRRSPKGADLRRDPRFALHASSPVEVDDEFFVRGHAEPTEPTPDLKSAIMTAAVPATVGADEEQLFQLYIDRALVATYTHRGQWPPTYERWSAPDN